MPASRRTSHKTSATEEGTAYGEWEPGSLSGNLTRDPELRFTPGGKAVASAGLAVNENVKNEETGKWEPTEPEFFDITVWGDQAERFSELVKGDRIVATGQFRDETYTSKQSGERVTKTTFTARDIGPSMLWTDVDIKRVKRGGK